MSIIPDIVLQTTIVRGIRAMRNDSRLLDQLFRTLDQGSLAQIRQFIKEQPIDLSLNYPRTALKVPAIVILLKSEKEAVAYIGDSMGMASPDEFTYDDETVADVLGGAASVSALSGNTKLVYGPDNALTGTENTLRVANRAQWVADQFVGNNLTIRIIGGTGRGQIRNITANGPSTVMIEGQWVTIPDKTSVFEIVAPPGELIGQPTSIYNRTQASHLERKGSMYGVTYQIQVIGPNPEFTIYLSVIIKAILTIGRLFLEKQGIINFKLSASDFVPRPEYQPELTYMRALTMEFVYPFDVFATVDGINAIDLKLEYDNWPEDVVVVSDTTINIDDQGNPVDPQSDVQRVYFGVATPPGSYDANFIQNVIGGQGTAIASKRQRAINFTTGPGEKMYYIYPASMGGIPGNFIDAGTELPIGMSVVATTSITTAFGTEPYNVWESDNVALGFVAGKIT